MENCSRWFADGYLEELEENPIRQLFICESPNQMISKSLISNKYIKNYTTILDEVERIDSNFTFHKIFLVGETFFEIDQETLEELKTKSLEIFTFEQEYFNRDYITKLFLKN